MQYEYSKTAGYYGNGGWICYTLDWSFRKVVYKVFATEQEAIEYCQGKK